MKNFNQKIKNKDGQVFIEFILLFLIVVSLSFLLIFSFNGAVGSYWKVFVEIVIDQKVPPVNLELR